MYQISGDRHSHDDEPRRSGNGDEPRSLGIVGGSRKSNVGQKKPRKKPITTEEFDRVTGLSSCDLLQQMDDRAGAFAPTNLGATTSFFPHPTPPISQPFSTSENIPTQHNPAFDQSHFFPYLQPQRLSFTQQQPSYNIPTHPQNVQSQQQNVTTSSSAPSLLTPETILILKDLTPENRNFYIQLLLAQTQQQPQAPIHQVQVNFNEIQPSIWGPGCGSGGSSNYVRSARQSVSHQPSISRPEPTHARAEGSNGRAAFDLVPPYEIPTPDHHEPCTDPPPGDEQEELNETRGVVKEPGQPTINSIGLIIGEQKPNFTKIIKGVLGAFKRKSEKRVEREMQVIPEDEVDEALTHEVGGTQVTVGNDMSMLWGEAGRVEHPKHLDAGVYAERCRADKDAELRGMVRERDIQILNLEVQVAALNETVRILTQQRDRFIDAWSGNMSPNPNSRSPDFTSFR